jgi:Gluconate 2-dehydrogenase subunit 3
MSELSRRTLLRGLAAAAAAAAGSVDRLMAQEVHQHIAEEQMAVGGPYVPKALTAHEYATLDRLTDQILPAVGSTPGARAAGAAAWIDSLAAENDQLLAIYTGGLAWLDRTMAAQGASDFLTASDAQQRTLLDQLSAPQNQSAELAAGVRFFTWVRRMTVDAFYTSKAGTDALGYRGNRFVAEFSVPPEVLEYMNKRSPI